jgi:N-alpha-acetyltransferase 38, NatC auxiliary subunit
VSALFGSGHSQTTKVLKDSNIILSNAFEYRAPSKQAEAHTLEQVQQTGEPTKGDMTSRFIGLIVVPKHQIIKIELEERRSEILGQELSLRPKE